MYADRLTTAHPFRERAWGRRANRDAKREGETGAVTNPRTEQDSTLCTPPARESKDGGFRFVSLSPERQRNALATVDTAGQPAHPSNAVQSIGGGYPSSLVGQPHHIQGTILPSNFENADPRPMAWELAASQLELDLSKPIPQPASVTRPDPRPLAWEVEAAEEEPKLLRVDPTESVEKVDPRPMAWEVAAAEEEAQRMKTAPLAVKKMDLRPMAWEVEAAEDELKLLSANSTSNVKKVDARPMAWVAAAAEEEARRLKAAPRSTTHKKKVDPPPMAWEVAAAEEEGKRSTAITPDASLKTVGTPLTSINFRKVDPGPIASEAARAEEEAMRLKATLPATTNSTKVDHRPMAWEVAAAEEEAKLLNSKPPPPNVKRSYSRSMAWKAAAAEAETKRLKAVPLYDNLRRVDHRPILYGGSGEMYEDRFRPPTLRPAGFVRNFPSQPMNWGRPPQGLEARPNMAATAFPRPLVRPRCFVNNFPSRPSGRGGPLKSLETSQKTVATAFASPSDFWLYEKLDLLSEACEVLSMENDSKKANPMHTYGCLQNTDTRLMSREACFRAAPVPHSINPNVAEAVDSRIMTYEISSSKSILDIEGGRSVTTFENPSAVKSFHNIVTVEDSGVGNIEKATIQSLQRERSICKTAKGQQSIPKTDGDNFGRQPSGNHYVVTADDAKADSGPVLREVSGLRFGESLCTGGLKVAQTAVVDIRAEPKLMEEGNASMVGSHSEQVEKAEALTCELPALGVKRECKSTSVPGLTHTFCDSSSVWDPSNWNPTVNLPLDSEPSFSVHDIPIPRTEEGHIESKSVVLGLQPTFRLNPYALEWKPPSSDVDESIPERLCAVLENFNAWHGKWKPPLEGFDGNIPKVIAHNEDAEDSFMGSGEKVKLMTFGSGTISKPVNVKNESKCPSSSKAAADGQHLEAMECPRSENSESSELVQKSVVLKTQLEDASMKSLDTTTQPSNDETLNEPSLRVDEASQRLDHQPSITPYHPISVNITSGPLSARDEAPDCILIDTTLNIVNYGSTSKQLSVPREGRDDSKALGDSYRRVILANQNDSAPRLIDCPVNSSSCSIGGLWLEKDSRNSSKKTSDSADEEVGQLTGNVPFSGDKTDSFETTQGLIKDLDTAVHSLEELCIGVQESKSLELVSPDQSDDSDHSDDSDDFIVAKVLNGMMKEKGQKEESRENEDEEEWILVVMRQMYDEGRVISGCVPVGNYQGLSEILRREHNSSDSRLVEEANADLVKRDLVQHEKDAGGLRSLMSFGDGAKGFDSSFTEGATSEMITLPLEDVVLVTCIDTDVAEITDHVVTAPLRLKPLHFSVLGLAIVIIVSVNSYMFISHEVFASYRVSVATELFAASETSLTDASGVWAAALVWASSIPIDMLKDVVKFAACGRQERCVVKTSVETLWMAKELQTCDLESTSVYVSAREWLKSALNNYCANVDTISNEKIPLTTDESFLLLANSTPDRECNPVNHMKRAASFTISSLDVMLSGPEHVDTGSSGFGLDLGGYYAEFWRQDNHEEALGYGLFEAVLKFSRKNISWGFGLIWGLVSLYGLAVVCDCLAAVVL
ncbi:hypothetical protein HDU67_000778 [Dinochytrium kinnereticum]|nr:hypothetical protein HDU67_000778 [Dinochytrium kinnereticum]